MGGPPFRRAEHADGEIGVRDTGEGEGSRFRTRPHVAYGNHPPCLHYCLGPFSWGRQYTRVLARRASANYKHLHPNSSRAKRKCQRDPDSGFLLHLFDAFHPTLASDKSVFPHKDTLFVRFPGPARRTISLNGPTDGKVTGQGKCSPFSPARFSAPVAFSTTKAV